MNFNDLFKNYDSKLKERTRELERVKKKHQATKCQLHFLQNCKSQGIVPKGFRLKKCGFTSKAQDKLLSTTEHKLVQLEINNLRTKGRGLKLLDDNLTIDIYARLSHQDFVWLSDILVKNVQRQKYIHDNNLGKKYNFLYEEKYRQTQRYERTTPSNHSNNGTDTNSYIPRTNSLNKAVNLTSTIIGNQALELLDNGPNFGVNTAKEHILDNIVRIHEFSKNNDELKNHVIADLDQLLSQTYVSNEVKLIVDLKKNKDIKITKADKGGKLVIMENEEYSTKLNSYITETYSKLKSDPTNKLTAKLRKYLKQELLWTDDVVNNLAPLHPKPPTIYGQPKIHKPGNPLRPIISQKDTWSSGVAKRLSKSIFELLQRPTSYIKNGYDFAQEISKMNENIDDYANTVMMSLDVVDMFTSIQPADSIDTLREAFNTISDSEFFIKMEMTKDQCLHLITFILDNCYFTHSQEFYLQTKGLAMGSSLSPLLANLYMTKFEKDVYQSYTEFLKVWKRYYDDVFLIWKGNDEQFLTFFNDVNSRNPNIKFTFEKENQRTLSFLDVQVSKTETYSTRIYSKPTSSSGLISFDSAHPLSLKINTASQKLFRIGKLCSNNGERLQEKRNLRQDLIDLNYPVHIISRIFKKGTFTVTSSTDGGAKTRKRYLPLFFIPDIQAQNKIKSFFNNDKARVAWKQKNTILDVYKKQRTPSKNLNLKNVIYLIPCSCGKFYIGETKRPCRTRIKEHQNYIKNKFDNSHLYQHLLHCPNHTINWEDCIILDVEPEVYLRKLKEAVFIFINQQRCISEPSIALNKEWHWLLNKHKSRTKVSSNSVFVI